MNTIRIASGTSIDPILRANRAPTRFVLEPGHYVSKGGPAFSDLDYCMLAPGCELIGAGPHLTDIWFDDESLPGHAAQFECLTAGSRSDECDRVRIEGLSIDCGSTYDSPDMREVGRIGLHCWSDVAIIRDVVVDGITGYRPSAGQPTTPSREGFGVLVNQPGAPGHNSGAHRVENVLVQLSERGGEERYVCGLYVGVASPLRFATVTDVEVVNPSVSPAHAAFGANGHVLGSRWRNHGRWNRAVFCDVSGGSNTIIDHSFLQAERVAVEFRGSQVVWTDIVVRGSRIILNPDGDAEYCAGLVLNDDAGSVFNGVRIEDCMLRGVQSSSKAALFYQGSASGPRVTNCGLIRCATIGATWLKPQFANKATASGYAFIS